MVPWAFAGSPAPIPPPPRRRRRGLVPGPPGARSAMGGRLRPRQARDNLQPLRGRPGVAGCGPLHRADTRSAKNKGDLAPRAARACSSIYTGSIDPGLIITAVCLLSFMRVFFLGSLG